MVREEEMAHGEWVRRWLEAPMRRVVQEAGDSGHEMRRERGSDEG